MTNFRLLHPKNASDTILVTLDRITILVRLIHPRKAEWTTGADIAGGYFVGKEITFNNTHKLTVESENDMSEDYIDNKPFDTFFNL